jgi:membrane-associated phospholipid phosphatase
LATDPAARLGRRAFLVGVGGVAAGTLAGGALAAPSAQAWRDRPAASRADAAIPRAWFDLSLTLVRQTPGFSPPVSSRAFAYAGVTLYEAIRPGLRGARSLAGQLRELTGPPEASGPHDWQVVANAALAAILRQLFPTASQENQAAIDALERRGADRLRRGMSPDVFRRSVDRGVAVARHVFGWSTSDGGHEGYLRNFPADYVPPTGPGLWVPTPPTFEPIPLQPHWGRNRTFAVDSGAAFPPPGHPAYSTRRSSDFYAEADEVYRTGVTLTAEQETIALYWADGAATITPPGHFIAIVGQVLSREGAGLGLAAEAYARLGIAQADAFICCWHTKYQYNLLRPVTYIRANINPAWMPLIGTPPFPEYTSGHSTQSGASAAVLAELFGANYRFTDHTHDELGFAPRSFRSFAEAAAEAAQSRLYGGIHYASANGHGLDAGWRIGGAANALLMR